MKALSIGTIHKALASLPTWKLTDNKITRQCLFENFEEAFKFMNEVAAVAQQLNHHPDWTNVYNRVDITLWTHDIQGLSEKDFSLAQAIENILVTYRIR